MGYNVRDQSKETLYQDLDDNNLDTIHEDQQDVDEEEQALNKSLLDGDDILDTPFGGIEFEMKLDCNLQDALSQLEEMTKELSGLTDDFNEHQSQSQALKERFQKIQNGTTDESQEEVIDVVASSTEVFNQYRERKGG